LSMIFAANCETFEKCPFLIQFKADYSVCQNNVPIAALAEFGKQHLELANKRS